ncbi:hypothetical protein NIES39_D03610 [Arthrospira platensis NIES-39]|nr:hypothetical protein NIES39_D03610 [Arthrospira platensis NIES-39]
MKGGGTQHGPFRETEVVGLAALDSQNRLMWVALINKRGGFLGVSQRRNDDIAVVMG